MIINNKDKPWIVAYRPVQEFPVLGIEPNQYIGFMDRAAAKKFADLVWETGGWSEVFENWIPGGSGDPANEES